MKFGRTISGRFNARHVRLLRAAGIEVKEGFAMFGIEEDDVYHAIVNELRDAPHFKDRRTNAIFSTEELDLAASFMMHRSSPNMVYSATFGSEEDGYDYLRRAFGTLCDRCNRPIGEQIGPLTLQKEPKLTKRYLWGSFHGVSGYLLTDHARYNLLKDTWGLEKREVLIGSKERVSEHFVQVDVGISPAPLKFGGSRFGRTFKLDGSGEIIDSVEECGKCLRPKYVNKILDYFPAFDTNIEYDVLFTQEWFGWYRRIVVSRDFAEWMVRHRFIKYHTHFLIPVKDSSRQ